ncbi:polynucleotide kinase-phosphatase [Radiobacillus sp. PE A8.2]|uniref:polynucleotide kinase-phosphatase n=1 Tax=Radiobacillus sp. PE A8.2 TaxID=3380349 RepID=UPI00388FF9B3
MRLQLPHAGIVLLVGPSNSGKTTLLRTLVKDNKIEDSEIVSSDQFRRLVSNVDFIDWSARPKDEADRIFETYQMISKEAFAMMDTLIEARCRLNKLTFIDATHLYPDDRKRYVALANKHNLPIVALVLDVDVDTLKARDESRDDSRGKNRIKQQYQVFKREKRFIKKEGYRSVFFIKDTTDLNLVRQNNPVEQDIGSGIDIIGDIHGCYDELIQLLETLGYEQNQAGLYEHPDGRTFVSIGDVMSRGPQSLDTMLFFLRHMEHKLASMIDSNHGWKIARWLDGRKVTLSHGDEKVAEEFAVYEQKHGKKQTEAIKEKIKDMLLEAPSHYVFKKNGVDTLVCAHAGIKDAFIGKTSYQVSDFCRYGDTDGTDDNGKPIRKDWTTGHQSSALIVWGHDPRPHPLEINNTINIDQGAVFGGKLTALRYPEKAIVSVNAKENYSGTDDHPLSEWERKRLDPPNIEKYIHGYAVDTKAIGNIRVQKEFVKAAIDTTSHFTVPLEQLVYIPPTMTPTPQASALNDYLEHPQEAIDYYRSHGVEKMVAEKKHMGSRAVLLLFKDREAAKKWIGFDTLGVIYSRKGRRFFDDHIESQVIEKINKDFVANGYFDKYDTDFVLLDTEIMPWNLKAQQLISSQYAHVAENASMDRKQLVDKLMAASSNNEELATWLAEYQQKLAHAEVFEKVFQKYCWDIEAISDIQIAPFHVLAHSKQTFFHETHVWHMEKNREFANISNLFVETEFKCIDDQTSEAEVIQWWENMTREGHEGIVIKPEYFITRNKGKLLQPAIKVRGRKYLNIIYGMDYLLPENLSRLKSRQTGKKQKLALKEFALGVEGIQRFVERESLDRIHECVLATIAMDAEPVDPRL